MAACAHKIKNMRTLRFLVIGKNREILATLKRVIEHNEGWHASIMEDERELEPFLYRNKVDAILLSSGLSELAEAGIATRALFVDENIKVIPHFGGGSGLLKNEIYTYFPELEHKTA